jgi:hypothetical protein
MKHLLAALTILLAVSAAADDAHNALSKNKPEADAAIAALRAQGQAGVDALAAVGAELTDSLDIRRYRLALDRVCRQRDCYTSRLFWYTDLEQAKGAARKSGKPILYLRLLGNLDDEVSCANSRFFRTTLYSNPDIAAFMREHFVLYWASERPVPKVTIDFGDGRTIRETITGNSIHYLLDAEGKPLDALPGLYSPAAFLAQLDQLQKLAHEYASAQWPENYLQQYHAEQIANLTAARDAGLRGLTDPEPRPMFTAAQASIRARSKAAVESRLLSNFKPGLRERDLDELKKVAAKHTAEVMFHPASLALMEKKDGPLTDAMLANLRQTVAEDTLLNEYDLHLRIHQMLVGPRPTAAKLNEDVYSRIFLTPASDPWLGLKAADTFTALQSAGSL